MEVKKAIKRVIALGAGATLVGTTIMGAMAASLADYPSPFVMDGKFDGMIVVGDQAKAEDALPHIDFSPDMLLIDPPVGGLGHATLDGILSINSATLFYVSRDPSTLARDATRLIEGGYQLQSVTPFDVTPHTPQIDSVTIFTKNPSQ